VTYLMGPGTSSARIFTENFAHSTINLCEKLAGYRLCDQCVASWPGGGGGRARLTETLAALAR